jgi:hypothetical protein
MDPGSTRISGKLMTCIYIVDLIDKFSTVPFSFIGVYKTAYTILNIRTGGMSRLDNSSRIKFN